MSCQIKGIANLINISNIKEVLYGDSVGKFDHVPSNELPLQECFVSLSSAGDVLVMAWNTKMIILISRWDSQEENEVKNKFHMIWNGNVTKEENEWVTSVICLPLVSLGKASVANGPDWTCIAVGYNTGYVRFYTETGALLLGEQLHNELVLGIKCQSFSSPRHTGDIGLSEEVYVLYNNTVCILQGFPLFSTLRACRNHLARVQANCNDAPPVTNLAYKKWSFKNQDICNDSEVIGTTSVNTFDHLMTASICGGYNASYRSSAPQHNLVIATGKRPFIGFHYALEGGTAPILSDVAIAMASKLATAIGTAVPWFRGNSKSQTSIDASKGGAHEPAEAMICRFGLSDIMREGDCIVSSPSKTLSVISDAMGRVILVDNKKGIAIRMWKGYRDAQCGWIEVGEEKHRGLNKIYNKSTLQLRTALFLVIYAPKKGVIDIWGIQQGSKITTFTASKNGRLLYINYGLLGTNDNISSKNKAQYSCVFMDPLGGLKEITVPFHFALNSKNGKRARDIHLFRKLKTFLREEEFAEEKLIIEVTNTCMELKTNEVRVQILEMLMCNKGIIPNALLAATNCFMKKLEEYEKEEMEPIAKTLYQLTRQLQRAIKFYKYIKHRFDAPPEYDTVTATAIPNGKSLASILLTSEREVHRILKLSKTVSDLERGSSKMENKVKFKEDGRAFIDFLSCFEFGTCGPINLQKDISMEKKYEISQLIYQGWMYSADPIEIWKDAAMDSNISPFVLMQLSLIYWMYKRRGTGLEIEIARFTQLLHAICVLANVDEVCADYNEISLWWKDVRNILSESANPFNALTAALACRAVAVTLERYREGMRNKQEDETQSSTSEWENVSKDTCQFILLIGNLEDVTILKAVVSQQPPSDETTLFFALPFEKCDISLATILSKGKGSVSEIVAKWLSSTGLDPAQLIDTTDIEFDQMQLSVDVLKVTDALDEARTTEISEKDQTNLLSLSVEIGKEAETDRSAQSFILDKLTMLKRHFPYSLTSSVILANLCWEFAMFWNKDVLHLDALEAALSVLRQIPMKHMRHGVCCLLWSLYIKKRMEATAKLMNKLGKLPKERLCMQDIGLSDIQLTTFLQHCVTFLDIFIDAEILETGKSSTILSEELWEGHPAGPQPFAVLAISQTPAWYELVLLHVQIANVLHMMAYFHLKILKPLNNLFESVAQPYFFQDITNTAMLTWYRDDKRDHMRTEFLCRVITASMEFIHQETTDGKTLSSTQAVLWMSKCQTLASIWKINNDELRIHQVCHLYINGFDRLAEEVVIEVNNLETLAANLLPIAGRRMMAYLSKTPDLLEEVSRISPTLTKYLASLDVPEMIYTNCSDDDIVELIRRVSRHLPETHCDYHLAQLMLDATFIYEGKT